METLSGSLDSAKKIAAQTTEQDVQLRALERDAKTERDLLESYLAKYREATARDSINAAPAEARIISRASPAIKPAFPKKLPTVLIAAFAGFALSAGFIVTGALLAVPPQDYGFASPMMAARGMTRVNAPSLMPMTAPPGAVAGAPVAVSTVEQIAKSMRHGGDDGRRVIVVGTMRNVGTSHAAITLARSLAQDANVVLVDLAFGSPNLSVISDRSQRARHCRTRPRHGVVRRHHHPRPVFGCASGCDRQRRRQTRARLPLRLCWRP